MIILESILLWCVAGCALLLIMAYVLKAPHTPERPQLGLGKRYQIGPRRVRTQRHFEEENEDIDMAPPPISRRKRTAENLRRQRPVAEQVSEQVTYQDSEPVQAVYRMQETQPVMEQEQVQAEPMVVEVQNARKTKKRTDTMQLMLNKAIAERR